MDNTTPAPTPQAPDFDAEALAVVDDHYDHDRDCFDLQGRIEIALRNAYAAGQRAARRQDVAEIRAAAALPGQVRLVAIALNAMADRLEAANG